MLSYYADLFARAFWAVPGLLGSNALGLVWPVLIVICGEILACVVYGWRPVIKKWKEASLIGFASLGVCYIILFAWSLFATAYQDHKTLASRNQILQGAVDGNAAHEQNAILLAENKCAETTGENKALGQQNRDQQNTINLCQTEAIRRLQPVPDKTIAYPIRELPGPNSATFIMLTNKPVNPATVLVSCDGPISGLQGSIINTEFMSYSPAYQVNERTWSFTIASPPWAPDFPMVISFKYPGSKPPNCKFERR